MNEHGLIEVLKAAFLGATLPPAEANRRAGSLVELIDQFVRDTGVGWLGYAKQSAEQRKTAGGRLFLWMGEETARAIASGDINTCTTGVGRMLYPQHAPQNACPSRDEVASWARAVLTDDPGSTPRQGMSDDPQEEVSTP